MIITTAIIDDEPLAATLLESYVNKTPFLQLTGTYGSAIEAIRQLRNKPVQLLFLDIQMPELSGIEFAKVLPNSTKIVFTSAFQQYAIDGYKVNALDYLMKPVPYNEFLKAAEKACEYFKNQQQLHKLTNDRFLFVKSDYKLIRIPFDNILFIEGLKDYVRFYLKSGERIMSLINMKRIDECLPHPEFLRVHKSYIVHMTNIETVERARIVFHDQYIPISDSYKDNVYAFLDLHTVD